MFLRVITMCDESTDEYLKGLSKSIDLILEVLAKLKKEEQIKIYNNKYRDNSYLFNSFDPDNYTLHKDEEKFIHYFIQEFKAKIKDTIYTKTIYDFYTFGLMRYFRISFPIYISGEEAKRKNIDRFSDTDVEHLKYRFKFFNKYQKYIFEFIDKLIVQTALAVNERKDPRHKSKKIILNNQEFWCNKIDYKVRIDNNLIGYDFRLANHKEIMLLTPVEFTL